MGKFLLSGFVILSLVAYSLWQNKNKADNLLTTAGANSISITPTSTPVSTSNATPQPSPSSTPTAPNSAPSPSSSQYKDGTFVGDAADAFYGFVQVQVVISGGKITDVQFLQYPNDRSRSMMISQYSLPTLRQEVIQAQSANVDAVSGASDTSPAFMQSVSSALQKASS